MRRAVAGLLAIAGVLGCGDPSGPEQRLSVAVAGRAERSLTVVLTATTGGTPVPAALVTWSAVPATSVTFLGNGQARLDSAGPVAIRAEAVFPENVRRGTRELTIAVPPRLVFDLLREGNRDIYSIELDGRNLLRLTTAAGDDVDPTAVGDALVFTSYRDGNAELYTRAFPSGAEDRLTITDANEIQPALAPDGTRLSYALDASGVFRIWLADADGSNASAVTAGFGLGGSIEASPAWAPTGGILAFVSTTGGTSDVYRLGPGGGSPQIVVDGTFADVEPAWSPDGQALAFVSDSTGDAELYLVRLDADTTIRLTERAGSDGEPAWLPDGRVVFTAFTGTTTTLRWLDPGDPTTVVDIPIGPGTPRRPAPVLP
jgi:Tol biopolymer transport system component